MVTVIGVWVNAMCGVVAVLNDYGTRWVWSDYGTPVHWVLVGLKPIGTCILRKTENHLKSMTHPAETRQLADIGTPPRPHPQLHSMGRVIHGEC